MVVVVCGKTWQKRQKACKNWWHIMSKSNFLFFIFRGLWGSFFSSGSFRFFRVFFCFFSERIEKFFLLFLFCFFTGTISWMYIHLFFHLWSFYVLYTRMDCVKILLQLMILLLLHFDKKIGTAENWQ